MDSVGSDSVGSEAGGSDGSGRASEGWLSQGAGFSVSASTPTGMQELKSIAQISRDNSCLVRWDIIINNSQYVFCLQQV
jgi:hypothetical protein